MAKFTPLAVVFIMALVLSKNPVRANLDCMSVFANMFPCASYLGSFLPLTPGTQCCDAASNAVNVAGDSGSLCQCLRLNPLASGFLPSKAQQLPSLCNISSFLPLVKCMLPPGGGAIPLPPGFPSGGGAIPLPPGLPSGGGAIPLPPWLTLPPVLPLPPFVNVPPLIPSPPLLSSPPTTG